MADQSSRTLQVPEREMNKAEEARMESVQRKQQQTNKFSKRELGLIALIVLLTLVICGLIGFIIGWFLWPHSSPTSGSMTENDEVYRSGPVDIDDVRIVNESVNTNDRSNNDSICLTKGCLQAGLQILDKMDPSINPCRDFWSYSCGAIQPKNAIIPTKSRLNPEEEVEMNMREKLMKLLVSKVGRIGKRSSERKVKRLYTGCVNTESLEREGKLTFLDAVGKLGGLAAIGLWSREKARDWKLSKPLEQLQLLYDTAALFSWGITPDIENPDKYILQLSEGGLTLPDRKFYLGNYSSPVLTAYRKFLRSGMVLIGATGKPVNRFIQDVYSFEKKLAKISRDKTADADMRGYNKTTVRELIVMSPEIDWRSFFRSFPGSSLSTEVLLTSPDYITNLSRLVASSYPRILQNYLAWRLLYKMMPFMSEKMRHSYQALETVVTGRAENPDRQRDCLDFVNQYMGTALGAIYSKTGPQKGERKMIRNMAETIKETFVKSLTTAPWMDEDTKSRALQKAAQLQVEIGYPEYVKITAVVDNYYSTFNVRDNQTFYQAMPSVIRASVLRRIERHGKQVDRTQWSWENINVHSVKASYNPHSNVIVLPSGYLQSGVFVRSFPSAINYGTLGTVLGREMLSSVMGQGSNFDENGRLNSWWTNDTAVAFQNEMECLSGLLGSSHPFMDASRGLQDVIEEADDVGGLVLSYKAWKTYNEDRSKIPGADLTPQQGVFVAFAQGLCGRSSHVVFTALKQPSLFGLKDFGEAFQCPPAPPVNTEPCSIL